MISLSLSSLHINSLSTFNLKKEKTGIHTYINKSVESCNKLKNASNQRIA
jgi:hypothetical protein